MVSVQRSFTLNILFFGWVDTREVGSPNVNADVRIAADVENRINELTSAVGNGARINNAGSMVINVVAVPEFASCRLEVLRSKFSLLSRQAAEGIIFRIEKE